MGQSKYIFLLKLFLDLEKGNKIDNSAQIYDRKVVEWFFEKTHCRCLNFFLLSNSHFTGDITRFPNRGKYLVFNFFAINSAD